MEKRLTEECRLMKADSVPFLSFDAFSDIDFIIHGFSTRLGGVSSSFCESMNLGFERGDKPENVLENYRRIAESVGFDYRSCVLTNQWHTTNVREVKAEDIGYGITRPRTSEETDGYVTNVPGAVLTAFGADCPTLFFVDPEKRAIGLSHSGWKGTLNNIAGVTVEKMHELYGTDPRSLVCVIGPGICEDCYEISDSLAADFEKRFPDCTDKILKAGKAAGKYQLDLREANRYNLLGCGILPENIHISGICTKCSNELLFSHRRDGNARGVMAAFLSIRS